MRRQILSITKKELSGYFGSLLALIFLGTFLAAVLFIFFSVETFFARGIADVRPLFRWMPVLLIFLLAALTMRQWSEEQQSGTKELLLTLPVRPIALVIGKFLAVMTMIALALALTLPLPITVGIIGNLDWGPVLGGYLAALLMAAAYAAIGLFVSSRTNNSLVALIVTVLVGGIFFLIGTTGVTNFVSGSISEILWAIGTGSRFESIQRGVIDLRDLVYYLSLAALFLVLNVVSLDAVRWSSRQIAYRRNLLRTTGLISLNLMLLNVWLFPLQGLRLDLTQQREYTLSRTSRNLFADIQEPLLIRAYISENNHPLLKPLVPRIDDMLREYEIASGGRISAELIDPISDPDIELEANQTYGIRPQPFQVAGRYEASVINAYFDILIRYGDQTVILNFSDLIQVNPSPSGELDISLRNLEYDLTSSIKRVVFGFQSIDAVLAELDEPVQLTFYTTPNTLPEHLLLAEQQITAVANEIAAGSGGQFVYRIINLDDPSSGVTRGDIERLYGLQPTPIGLFSAESYYAHIILQNGDERQLLYPPADATEGSVRTLIESALKRSSSGFLKEVGIWTPPPIDPQLQQQQFGQPQPLADYARVRDQLRQEYTLQDVDLLTGQVPPEIDTLLVISPLNLSDLELFAIDQFLMRGGAVTLLVNANTINIDPFSGSLVAVPANIDNLINWLASHGVTLGSGMVLDVQNAPFPLVVAREVGDIQVQELQAQPYPYFVDVRPNGMNSDSPIMASLPAAILNWASVVTVDATLNEGRETAQLLFSSDRAWQTEAVELQPNFELYPELGFTIDTEQRSYPLAASITGVFNSYFDDIPLGPATNSAQTPPTLSRIPQSPATSRLVVIGSNAFVEDNVLNLSSQVLQDAIFNNLQFMQNAVDWSVEDVDLLAIRARGTQTRILNPMSERAQSIVEIGNYIMALIALLVVYFNWQSYVKNEEPLTLLPPTGGESS